MRFYTILPQLGFGISSRYLKRYYTTRIPRFHIKSSRVFLSSTGTSDQDSTHLGPLPYSLNQPPKAWLRPILGLPQAYPKPIHIHIQICMYIYIHINKERERERERYIYIYIFMWSGFWRFQPPPPIVWSEGQGRGGRNAHETARAATHGRCEGCSAPASTATPTLKLYRTQSPGLKLACCIIVIMENYSIL